jgi:type III restriction enzyme
MSTAPFAVPDERLPSRLPVVQALRAEVNAWRGSGYPGASATTRRLLEHWFLDAHQAPDGTPFAYYFAQREAVETIVYLHEVARVRTTAQLVSRYTAGGSTAAGQPYPRYVVKMATGAGKTKVMSLLVAWSYFHSQREDGSELSSTSLVVAPNLIVFERLREDFEHGRVFRDDPVLPPEWREDFDLQVVLRDDPAPLTSAGALLLTNVHVLYERRVAQPANPVEALLGPAPPRGSTTEPPLLRLARRGRVLVLNDEAHHLHDEVKADTGEPLVAVQTMARLHELSDGLAAQLDFSATPRNQQGQPFAEIVSDYPLASAITDGIVKRPVIGELSGELEAVSADASVRYRQRLAAGVAKWREDAERLAPTGRHPLLFVMAEDTAAADDIARYLESLTDLAGRVLTIHVNLRGANRGEVTRDDLEEARDFARHVDDPDQPYRAIVSVLMLREGWDVRNVTVIVPLRAYTSRAQILPEQTLGRGLRRMTRPGSGVAERVVVIEHEQFRSLWDEELAEEGLVLDRARPEDLPIPAEVIAVVPERVADHDIAIPQLSRRLQRTAKAVAELRLEDLPARRLPLDTELAEETISYRGRDLLTSEVVEEATYPLPRADDPTAVLAWYTHEIQRDSRLTGQFAVLAPLFRDYVEQRAFARPVAFDEPAVLRALSTASVQETLFGVFRAAIDAVTLLEADVRAQLAPKLLSTTRPFLWSGETAAAAKSVFSLQPCDSGLEVELCGFLDRCDDVASFAKLAPEARFSMEYRNDEGRLAFYYPDFVVALADGECRVVEAKGLVDVDVPVKDRRAAAWAVDASLSSGTRWSYLRVDQALWQRHAASARFFAELEAAVRAQRREEHLRRYEPREHTSVADHLRIMEEARRRSAASGDMPDIDEAIRRFRDDPRG